jgi:hypothetical protein
VHVPSPPKLAVLDPKCFACVPSIRSVIEFRHKSVLIFEKIIGWGCKKRRQAVYSRLQVLVCVWRAVGVRLVCGWRALGVRFAAHMS